MDAFPLKFSNFITDVQPFKISPNLWPVKFFIIKFILTFWWWFLIKNLLYIPEYFRRLLHISWSISVYWVLLYIRHIIPGDFRHIKQMFVYRYTFIHDSEMKNNRKLCSVNFDLYTSFRWIVFSCITYSHSHSW